MKNMLFRIQKNTLMVLKGYSCRWSKTSFSTPDKFKPFVQEAARFFLTRPAQDVHCCSHGTSSTWSESHKYQSSRHFFLLLFLWVLFLWFYAFISLLFSLSSRSCFFLLHEKFFFSLLFSCFFLLHEKFFSENFLQTEISTVDRREEGRTAFKVSLFYSKKNIDYISLILSEEPGLNRIGLF